MGRSRYAVEQIIRKLREADIELGQPNPIFRHRLRYISSCRSAVSVSGSGRTSR